MTASVFADLGHPAPPLAEAKSRLVTALTRIIDERGLTEAQAAKSVGLEEPALAMILRGRTRRVSIDELNEMIDALRSEVEADLPEDVRPL